MKVRRIATGHNVTGRATIASDTNVDAITVGLAPGWEFHRLWGADEVVSFPDDGSPPANPAYFPPVHGFRFGMFTVPPMSDATIADIDFEHGAMEIEEKLPGMAAHMEPDNPGMHTTDTIDFEYVISGEVWLELDDGQEVLVKAGDTVVQNGTRHAWRNKSGEPCRLLVCLIGANRREV